MASRTVDGHTDRERSYSSAAMMPTTSTRTPSASPGTGDRHQQLPDRQVNERQSERELGIHRVRPQPGADSAQPTTSVGCVQEATRR